MVVKSFHGTNQAGNFQIGDDIVINQLTGTISGEALQSKSDKYSNTSNPWSRYNKNAAIALNKFRTIRVGVTTNNVGIYTCPLELHPLILSVTTLYAGVCSVTATHSRGTESPTDFKFASDFPILHNDSVTNS